MIVILRPEASQEAIGLLMEQIRSQGVEIHYSRGTQETILGLVGDTTHVDEDWLRASGVVADVRRVSEPYKLANRRFHPEDTRVDAGGRTIGEGTFTVIAGPCSAAGGRPGREEERRDLPARRRVQAQDVAVLVPGAGKRGPCAAARGEASHRTAHRHRDHERDAA